MLHSRTFPYMIEWKAEGRAGQDNGSKVAGNSVIVRMYVRVFLCVGG